MGARSRSGFLAPWIVLTWGTLVAMLYQRISGRLILPSTEQFLPLFGIEFLALILWVSYWMWLYPVYLTPFRALPTPPKRWFFTGNRPIWFPPNPQYQLLELIRTVQSNGVMRYYGPTNLERLLITGPEGLKDILVTNFVDFDHQSLIKLALKRFTGSDLADLKNDEYKLHRRQLAGAFSVPHTKSLAPEFFRQARRMIQIIERDYLQDNNSEAAVPLHDYVYRTTLDNIGFAGMGYDFGTLENPQSEVLAQYHKLGIEPTEAFNWVELMSHYINFKWLLYVPLPKNLDVLKGSAFLRKLSLDIIHKKQQKMEAGKLEPHEKKDIIAMTLAEGGVISSRPDYMADHIMTLIQGGHDSTSATFQWAVFELGRRPDLQRRLRDEVRTYLSPSLESATGANILELPYLSAIVNETLRCYPFLPIMLREAVRDSTIMGHPVPKDTIVVYSAYAVNRDRSLWGPDADEWNPDRWMAPGCSRTGGATTNYAMTTFGHGPRKCLGQNFARVILPCLLAALIGRYEIQMTNGSELGKPKPGLRFIPYHAWAKLKRVEGW
ncbi:Cytochrome P450 [Rhypophila decipiens]